MKIGWASTDLTPEGPVILTGQRLPRVSEGVMDPVTATALALESGKGGAVIMISCDFISIPDEIRGGDFRGMVRERVGAALPSGANPKVVLNATHTHAGPEIRTAFDIAGILGNLGVDIPEEWARWGVKLNAVSPPEYVDFAVKRIAEAAVKAWEAREPGGISFGLSHAVVGHNRVITYDDGSSQIYRRTAEPQFSHVEGWEDHSINIVFTWGVDRELTGLILNIPSPAQHDENIFEISADFYHEVREELRARLGSELYVLPQNAAAGDQSQRVMIHRRAEERMEKITGKNRRERIAERVADAVESVLPYLREHIEWNPIFRQSLEKVDLSRQDDTVTKAAYESAKRTFEASKQRYLGKLREIEGRPDLLAQRGVYRELSSAYRSMAGQAAVIASYREQQESGYEPESTLPVEIYVLRLGDFALATNPFELYLDFGIRIQERSRAVQTFIVQLAGSGSYIAPARSVEKGGYGSRNRLFKVPEAGRELVEHTLDLINSKFGVVSDVEFKHNVEIGDVTVKHRTEAKDVEREFNVEKAASVVLPREGWRFKKDPDDAGIALGWYDPEFEDGAWRDDVLVEKSWQEHLEHDYHGVAWYRLALEPLETPYWKKVYLHFGGVDEQCWIWVNGELAGEHAIGPSGWDVPFMLEITGHFKPHATNHITVRARNTVGAGGIWRPVQLFFFR